MPPSIIPLPKTVTENGAKRSIPLSPTAYDYGYRPVASQLVTQAVTPEEVGSILQDAEDGDPAQFLELAERMEEKDLNYRAVLSTRKLAVTGMDVVVESVDDDALNVAAADLAREVLMDSALRLGMKDVLDALGKGFSVCQIIWETTEKQWRPASVQWCNPVWFRPAKADGRTVKLVNGYGYEDTDLLDLEKNQFIVHTPAIKSAIVIKRGLARVAVWAYIFKNYTIKDWLRASEIYGTPFRLGKYVDKAHRGDLLSALKSMGTDAYGVIPDTAQIEFIAAPGGDGSIYERLADWADKQVAIGVLGQYGTVQSVPGQLGAANEKSAVREDIQIDDAVDLAATLRRDLITPLIRFNLGEKARIPIVRFQLPEVRQPELIVSALERLVPLGLDVEKSWARDQFGIPDPEPGAELLGAPQPVIPAAAEPAEEPEPQEEPETEEPEAEEPEAEEQEEATKLAVMKALSDGIAWLKSLQKPATTPVQAAVDSLGDKAMAATDPTAPIPIDLLREAVVGARDELDLTERLALLAGQRNDYDAIIEQAMFAARLIGFVASKERTE